MTKKHLINSNEIKVSDLIDNLVYTDNDGKQIGRIIKITFNHLTKKVSSLIIKESLWSRKLFLVKIENVRNIGRDLVNVSSIKDCLELESTEFLNDMTFQSINKHRVITDDGKLLGVIEDMVVSQKSFKILGFILNDDSLLKVNPNQIVLGRDEIIVPRGYESKIIENSKETIFSKYINFKSYRELTDNIKPEPKNKNKAKIHEGYEEEVEI